jgi:hypothetical protein
MMSLPVAGPRRTWPLRDEPDSLEKLEQLGELQCAPSEAALAFGGDEAKLTRFLARSRAAREAFDAGRLRGLEAMRRAQFKLAQTNAAMAMFLGKTYLGQSESRESDQSGAIDLSQAGQRVRDKLAALAAIKDPQGDC